MAKTSERNGIKELDKVCRAVLKLQDDDFEKMEVIYKNQLRYSHPLKMKTSGAYNSMGAYNEKITTLIKELRKTLLERESYLESK